jgi:two-component system invasion response regulator UvrY
MRIIIADDHTMVRKGIRLILSEAYPGMHIEEACDGNELLAKVCRQEWDIIISDISMPGRSGIEVIKELRQLAPQTPLLILSSHPAEQYAVRVIKSGAACYLTKESAPEELIKAIEALSEGKRYFSEEVIQIMTESIDNNYLDKLHNNLTDKEFEILKQLASGKTVSEISAFFSLSRNTVSLYRTRIFEKIQVSNTADLVRYSIENQLVG